MTYEEWKTASEAARAKTDEASRIWNEVFPCNGKLPSDTTRVSKHYLALKADYDKAAAEHRAVYTGIPNAWMRKAARARRNR